MSIKKAYEDYQEIFLALYAMVIIGATTFFYVSSIINMIEIAGQATTINQSAATSVEFRLEEAKKVFEQRAALQKSDGGL